MPALPPNSKSPIPSNPPAIPSSWAGLLADSATADWKDAYPVAQSGKGTPGPKGQLLLVAEVAAVLRRTEATVRDYLRLGSLIGHRVGCHWRVYEADLDAFLFAKTTGTPEAASAISHIPLLDLSAAIGSAATSDGLTKAIPIFLNGTTLKSKGPSNQD